MAEKKDKKKEEAEIILERVYNVPLRREWLKSPKYKRAKKAITALKEFIIKHMKSEDVKIGKHANLEIWKHGIKNPPHHIKIKAVKDKSGLVTVELEGKKLKEKVPSVLKKAREKLEKKPKKEEKALEEPKTPEEISEEKKEDKKEKAKEIEKEELKTIKKEKPESHTPKAPVKEKTVEQKPNAPSSQ